MGVKASRTAIKGQVKRLWRQWWDHLCPELWARGGDCYLSTCGDLLLATCGDLLLATCGDFLMAMDIVSGRRPAPCPAPGQRLLQRRGPVGSKSLSSPWRGPRSVVPSAAGLTWTVASSRRSAAWVN